MRVFTFLLMVMVAIGGGLTGYRVITGRDLVRLSDLGITAVSSAPAPKVTPRATVPPVPTATPVPTPTEVPPTPTPEPPAAPQLLVVAHTDGQGVFLRKSPSPEDKIRAWMEGSRMEVVGPDIQAGGKTWKKVKAPDGQEGYIPQDYLAEQP